MSLSAVLFLACSSDETASPGQGAGGALAGGGTSAAGNGGSKGGNGGATTDGVVPGVGNECAATCEAFSFCTEPNDGCSGGLCVADIRAVSPPLTYCSGDCSTQGCPDDFTCAVRSDAPTHVCVLKDPRKLPVKPKCRADGFCQLPSPSPRVGRVLATKTRTFAVYPSSAAAGPEIHELTDAGPKDVGKVNETIVAVVDGASGITGFSSGRRFTETKGVWPSTALFVEDNDGGNDFSVQAGAFPNDGIGFLLGSSGNAARLGAWQGELVTPVDQRWDFSDGGGIWGAADDDVWACGSRMLAHWDGATWTDFEPPAKTAGCTVISGSAANDVWLITRNGQKLRHWNGSSWTEDGGAPGDFNGLFAVPGALYLSSVYYQQEPRLVRYDSGGLTQVDVSSIELYAVGGTGPSDVWLLGGKGALHLGKQP